MIDTRTPDLFAESPTILRELGNAGRDAGIKTAVDRADETIDEWSARAYAYIVSFAKRGAPFTCPQVRAAAEADGFPLPPSAFAWGGPMNRASRDGVIKRCGFVQHGDATMHTQGVSQWIKA